MKIGVSFPTTEVGNDPIVMRDFAQAAEDMGYEYLTAIDHVLQARDPAGDDFRAYYTIDNAFHEPLILFSYLAGVTSKIGFVTAILILPQRPTVLVAKQAAQLDLMSGGRLRLGCGIGWNDLEFDAMDQNFKNRARRISEQFDLMKQLWTEETVTFEGEFHKIEDAGINPRPIQQPIPLWIGAFVDPAIRRAGPIADGWLVNPRVSAGAEAEPLFEQFRKGAEEAGRNADALGIDATVLAGDRGPQAWAADAVTWKSMGATHLTFRTMAAGVESVDAHIDSIRKFKDAYG
ncbi:MAG: LLM class F420-dependent oxidoreductase [Alphaproteobacteria bacterium]|nr:LLM class F420-dependent oxidoreductase [Alphaproteobacteria bacterium]